MTAGPIIDLKATRIPDPPGPAKEPPKGTVPPAGSAAGKPEPGRPEATRPGVAKPNPASETAKPDAARPGQGSAPPAGPASHGTAAPAPRPPAARGVLGAVAAAGLLGGVAGAALLLAVSKAGLLGAPVALSALDQRLSGRIETLDQRVGGLASKDALAALDTRVSGTEAAAKQAVVPAPAAGTPEGGQGAGQAAGQTGGQVSLPADLAARLDSLDQRVAALQEEPGREQPADARPGAGQADGATQLAALDARVKALEGAEPKPGGEAGTPAPAPDMSRTLAALQGEVEARTKANADADTALGGRLDGLQQALDARVTAATEAVQTATQAIRTAAEAGQAKAAEAAKAVDQRLTEQGERIASLDRSVADRAQASTVQTALRLVVADRVASALAAGTPYAEPLATLRRLDPDAGSRAEALAPFAETGAPTAAQLAGSFRAVADRIAAKRRAARAQAVADSSDFRTKLLSMADGLVSVRKTDAPAPEAATVPEDKVQAALDRGDLYAAAAAFAALPPEGQAEAGDVGAQIKARAQAGQAAAALTAEALKALPAPAAGQR